MVLRLVWIFDYDTAKCEQTIARVRATMPSIVAILNGSSTLNKTDPPCGSLPSFLTLTITIGFLLLSIALWSWPSPLHNWLLLLLPGVVQRLAKQGVAQVRLPT